MDLFIFLVEVFYVPVEAVLLFMASLTVFCLALWSKYFLNLLGFLPIIGNLLIFLTGTARFIILALSLLFMGVAMFLGFLFYV